MEGGWAGRGWEMRQARVWRIRSGPRSGRVELGVGAGGAAKVRLGEKPRQPPKHPHSTPMSNIYPDWTCQNMDGTIDGTSREHKQNIKGTSMENIPTLYKEHNWNQDRT